MSTRFSRSLLVLSSLSVLACAPPQFSCPDGYTVSPEGRCVMSVGNDAASPVMGDGGALVVDAGSDGGGDAGVDASPIADAASPVVDAALLVDASRCGEMLWYYDGDGDGHGSAADHQMACTMPVHYVASGDDCDDAHATVYPGAPEICDGLRNGCDGGVADAELLRSYFVDCDHDGFAPAGPALTTCLAPPTLSCASGQYIQSPAPTDATHTDCDDTNPNYRPDNRYYPDCDGDFYIPSSAAVTTSCRPPTTAACTTGTVSWPQGVWQTMPLAGADCWDFDSRVHPGSSWIGTAPYSTGLGSSFDYDCDGVASHVLSSTEPRGAVCTRVITTGACGPGSATWAGAPPPCGNSGTTFTCANAGGNCNATQTPNVVASCR